MPTSEWLIHQRWLDEATLTPLVRSILSDPPPRRADRGGHRIGDASYVERVVPGLIDLIEPVRKAAADAFDCEVLPSPWFRSSISVKVYEAGDGHVWHYDSNSITALLVLVETGEATTTFRLGADEVRPPIGNGGLLLMRGDLIEHCVPAIAEGDSPRVTVPVNLYLEGRVHRPEGQDRLVYGA